MEKCMGGIDSQTLISIKNCLQGTHCWLKTETKYFYRGRHCPRKQIKMEKSICSFCDKIISTTEKKTGEYEPLGKIERLDADGKIVY